MEAFVIAIVLITSMVFGTGDKQRKDHTNHSSVSPASDVQSADREQSVYLCNPDLRHIRQRDLTLPLNPQINNDER